MRKSDGHARRDGLTVFRTTVVSNDKIAPSAFLLSFGREFDFVPGQVTAITLEPDDEVRLYSIASGKDEQHIGLLYTVLGQGYLTPRLAKLEKGDMLYYSLPFGSFTGTGDPAYWIASGTGIAPFASMLRSGLGQHKILAHGSRYLHAFYFEDLFMTALGKDYIRCCSQEQGRGAYPGRLTAFLQEQTELPLHYKYYLCGSAEMIIEVRKILLAKGISFSNILAEIYF